MKGLPKNKIITVVAHIHPDGDVYIKSKGKFHFAGYLVGENEKVCVDDEDVIISTGFPSEGYLKAKEFWNKK